MIIIKNIMNKALTFLEWFDKNVDNLCYADFGKIEIVSQFYCQTFKPEMIVELFEDWEYSGGRYRNRKNHYAIFTNEMNEYVIYPDFSVEQYAQTKRFVIPKPPIIDVFISDCTHIGMELKFKPEIVKEYFV